MFIDGLDEKDNEILALIEKNARLSFTEIGEQVGLSRVAVKNRMESMEEKGVIRGYRTMIHSDSAAPNGIKFFLDLEVHQPSFEYVLGFLCRRKCIKEVYTTTGGNHIHAIGFTPNMTAMQHFVDELYRKDIGVRKLTCHIVMSTIKDVDGGIDYEKYKETQPEVNENDLGNR